MESNKPIDKRSVFYTVLILFFLFVLNNQCYSQGYANRCRVRVLFCVSPTISASDDDLRRDAIQSINWTNKAKVNSKITYGLELAGVRRLKVDPAQGFVSGLGAHYLEYIINQVASGNLPEVDYYADYYDADVVVIVRQNNTSGAIGISGGPSNPVIAIVGIEESLFAHEYGHLFDCEHGSCAILGAVPFECLSGNLAQGYDFFYAGKIRKTIMCYDSNIQYFSNPDATYSGTSISVGNLQSNCACAQMEGIWKSSGTGVSQIRPVPINKAVGLSFPLDTVNEINIYDYHFSIGILKTMVGRKINVNSGAEGYFRGIDGVVLYPGFLAKEGSKFSATQGDCTNVKPNVQDSQFSDPITTEVDLDTDVGYTFIYPNPVKDCFQFSVNWKGKCEVSLFDLGGKPVAIEKNFRMENGVTYCPPKDLKGLFLLKVSFGARVYFERIVFN